MSGGPPIRIALLLLEGSVLHDVGAVLPVLGPRRAGALRPALPDALAVQRRTFQGERERSAA